MFTCIEKSPKHWPLSLVQVRNVYELFFTFSFRDTRRERHNFYYADRSIWPNKRAMQPVGPNWTGLAQAQKSTSLPQVQISTRLAQNQISPRDKFQLTAFFLKSPRIPAHRFRAWRHPHLISHLGFLLWHLTLSHPPRVSVNTCTQCVHLH